MVGVVYLFAACCRDLVGENQVSGEYNDPYWVILEGGLKDSWVRFCILN